MDDDLIQWLKEGRREAAFSALVQRYQHKAFRLAWSILGDEGRAEESAQEAFLKLWQALPAFDGRAALSTWLYSIVRNTALSRLRAERLRRAAPLDGVHAAAAGVPLDARLEVERQLGRLNEAQRQAVVLFYIEDRDVREVARMLDMPEGSVKSLLHRARRALAAIMEEVR